jgi:hypothetical protein
MAQKIGNGLDLLNQKIINVADPTNPTDAGTKQYIDNVARGLNWKPSARAASTANIVIATPGATIDGVTMAVNDRFLAKNQTTGSENGIYVWNGAATPATRALDAATTGQLVAGSAITVTEGTVNADKVFNITSDGAITIGTTATTWSQLGGSGAAYTGSNGILLTGQNFTGVADPVSGGGIIVGAAGFKVDTAVVARKLSATIGNGALTVIPVTHNLGTQDVEVSLRDVATNTAYITDYVATDINTVTFTFATAPTTSQFRATIVG